MAEKAAWDFFVTAVHNDGDIEYLELGGPDMGRTFRFRIRTASRSDDSSWLNLVSLPGRCAFQFPNKNWYEIGKTLQVAFSERTFVDAQESPNGQIDFETTNRKGTYYPPGLNLDWSEVKKAPSA